MRLIAVVRAHSASIARAVVVLALVADTFLLRGLLLGRDDAIARFDRFAAIVSGIDALAIVAFGIHVRDLARTRRLEPSANRSARDARALLLGSAGFTGVYLGFHIVHGPLGGLVRGFDAYGVVDDIGRSFSTIVGAAVHAVGLVAILLHAFEVTAGRARASRQSAVLVVSLAFAFVVTTLDPIAAITVGRPLFSRRTHAGHGMTSESDSARLPRR